MKGWGGKTEKWMDIDSGPDAAQEAAADDSRLEKPNAKLSSSEPQ